MPPNTGLITNQTEAIRAALHSQRGSLGIVMLIDQDGQPIGLDSAQDRASHDTFDALLALAKRVLAYDPAAGWDLIATDDPVTFFDWDGQQVLCKAFAADNRTWLLVALVPADKPYKQALAKVIKALQAILNPPPVKIPKLPKEPKPKKPRASRAKKATSGI